MSIAMFMVGSIAVWMGYTLGRNVEHHLGIAKLRQISWEMTKGSRKVMLKSMRRLQRDTNGHDYESWIEAAAIADREERNP